MLSDLRFMVMHGNGKKLFMEVRNQHNCLILEKVYVYVHTKNPSFLFPNSIAAEVL